MTNAGAAIARTDKLRLDLQRPWPGPSTFTEDQRAYFFGRREQTDELFACVKRGRLTVLCGKSGLGKSSLLQAGLFPLLRHNGYLPIYLRLKFGDDEPLPDAQVKAKLEESILEHCSPEALPAPGESAWEYLHRRQKTLVDKEGNAVLPVVVFDQFEEWFIKGARTAVAEPFLASLTDLIENRVPEALEAQLAEDRDLARRLDLSSETAGYKVLVAMREDYVAHLQDLKETIPSLASRKSEMRLTEMNGRQALSVVLGPNPELVTPEVAERIVRLVAGTSSETANSTYSNQAASLEQLEVAPWILSLVCWRLNENRIKLGLGQITGNLVEQQGSTIIEDFYNESLNNMHPAVRRLVEDRLLNKNGERDSVDLEEAKADLERDGAPPGSINQLIELRLLSVDDRNPKKPRLELTHDVLAIPAKRSRDNWQAEKDLAEARHKAAAARRHNYVFGAVALAMVALAIFAGWQWLSARSALQEKERVLKEEETLKQNATTAQKNAEAALAAKVLADQKAEKERQARLEQEVQTKTMQQTVQLQLKLNVSDKLKSEAVRRELASSKIKGFEDCMRRASQGGDSAGVAGSPGIDAARRTPVSYEQALKTEGCNVLGQQAMSFAFNEEPAKPQADGNSRVGEVEWVDALTLAPLRLADSHRLNSKNASAVSQDCRIASDLADSASAKNLPDPAKRRSIQLLAARAHMICAFELASVSPGQSATQDQKPAADGGQQEKLSVDAGQQRDAAEKLLQAAGTANFADPRDWDRLADTHLYNALYLMAIAGPSDPPVPEDAQPKAKAAHQQALTLIGQSYDEELAAGRLTPNDDQYLKYILNRGIYIGRYARLLAQSDCAGDAGCSAGFYRQAASWFNKSLDVAGAIERLNEARQLPETSTQLAIAYGNLSWEEIQAGDFKRALDAANKGLRLDPDLRWIAVNRAHALLFTGQTSEARRLYLDLKDGFRTSKTMEPLLTDLRSDFEKLCKFGQRRNEFRNPQWPAIWNDVGVNLDPNTCVAGVAGTVKTSKD